MGTRIVPSYLGDWRGSYGTKPAGKSMRQPWHVSAPESCTCSSSFLVLSALQYLQAPTNTGIMTVALTVSRLKRSWGVHTGLKLGFFCIWIPLLPLNITGMSLISLTCNCGCKRGCSVISHKQGVCIWSGLIAVTAKNSSIWFFRDLHRSNLKRLLGQWA